MAKSKTQTDPAKLAHETSKVWNDMPGAAVRMERHCRAANCTHSFILASAPAYYTTPQGAADLDSIEPVYYCIADADDSEPSLVPPCKLAIGASKTCKKFNPFMGSETIDLY